MMQVKKKTSEIKNQEAKRETIEEKLKSLDVEIAKNLLKKLSVQLQKDKRDSLAAFYADPLIDVKDNVIHFTVSNKLISENIKELEYRTKSYFAANGYQLIEIICTVNAKKIEDYKLFTPQQKFDAMAKKNPILADFAARFNLEIDG